MSVPTIYILYNAKASVVGKLDYARKKLSASADSPPCSACDLTHGGLRLTETAAWKEAKRRIDARIEQLHQDELSSEVAQFVIAKSVQYPAILGQNHPSTQLKLLIDGESLKAVSKDHDAFLRLLIQRAGEQGIPLTLRDHESSLSTLE